MLSSWMIRVHHVPHTHQRRKFCCLTLMVVLLPFAMRHALYQEVKLHYISCLPDGVKPAVHQIRHQAQVGCKRK